MRMRTVTAGLAALALAAPAAAGAQSSLSPTPMASPTGTPTPTATPAPRTKAVQRVYNDFTSDGLISVCRHSLKTLKRTLATIDPEFATENPDFRAAVKAGIARHERGGCKSTGASNTAHATPTPGVTATPAPAATPAPTVAPLPTTSVPPPTVTPSVGSTRSPLQSPESGRLRAGIPRSGSSAKTPTPSPTPSSAPPAATPAAPVATPTPGPPRLVVERAHGDRDLTVPGALLGAAILVAVLLGLSALAAARSPRLAGMHHAWREAAYRTRGTWRDFSEWLRLGR